MVEHIPSLDQTLEMLEAARDSLMEGGVFYCRVPNAGNLIATHSLFADLSHYRLYTSGTLCQMLAMAGFSQCEVAKVKSGSMTGRVRLWLEHYMHRFVFYLSGRVFETVFSRNVCAFGLNESAGRDA